MNYKNYINGKWQNSLSGKTITVENPYTQEIIAEVPDSDEKDVMLAVSAAKEAFDKWKNFTPSERKDLLKNVAEISRENSDALAKTITLEMGKPFKEAKDEIETVAEFLDYYSELARDEIGKIVSPNENNTMSLVKYEAVGPIGCIVPWNYPLALMGWKLAPALAAGNTVIMKPSEITPLSMLHWCSVIDSVLPPGVINVITGYGESAGGPIVEHPDVPVITFTGSVDTGKTIAKIASKNLKRVSLELGGKDPMIICDDADIEIAAKGTAWGAFKNSGQICTSIERVYVYDNIYEKFTEAIIEEAKSVVIGDPLDPKINIGPMVSKRQRDAALKIVKESKEEGARLLTGGGIPEKFEKGYFFEPTVFDSVNSKMSIMTQETFCPIIPIQRVSNLKEAIKYSNNSIYGLACSIYTKDIDRALTAADEIQSGTVCINSPLSENIAAPFGGMKHSGIGREHGKEALDEFREIKHVYIDYKQETKSWWF